MSSLNETDDGDCPKGTQPITLAQLLSAWDAEDHTDSADEINSRKKESEELKQQLNFNRLLMEGPGLEN